MGRNPSSRRIAGLVVLGLLAPLLAACAGERKCRGRTWRSRLEAPVGGPQARAYAKVRAREVRCGYGKREVDADALFPIGGGGDGGGSDRYYRFTLFIRRATPGVPLEIFLSNSGGSFVSIGTVWVNERGRGKLKSDGSLDADDRIEVRDGDGEVVLEGNAPSTVWKRAPSGLLVESLGVTSPVDGSTAAVDYARDPGSDRERLLFEFGNLPPGAWIELFLDGKDGAPVIARRAGPAGVVRLGFDTRSGPALPGGALRVRDLWHRRARVQVDGDTVFEGPLPAVGARAKALPAR